MELILEMLDDRQPMALQHRRKVFTRSGGVIGRSEQCDWVIPDTKRYLSNQHATVSYREGAFWLTDTSSNGILDGKSCTRLPKGEPVSIKHGSVYVLGDFKIQARLACESIPGSTLAQPGQAASFIPNNASLGLDAPGVVEGSASRQTELDSVLAEGKRPEGVAQPVDYARIDTENLIVPRLIAPPEGPACPPALSHAKHDESGFWKQLGDVLGVSLQDLDQSAREAVVLDAARLLQQSIGGLQQCLRTRSALKNELRLAQTTLQGSQTNPLKLTLDTKELLSQLLRPAKPGRLSAAHSVSQAYQDVQAHQMALLAACRDALRGALEYFSPQQLTLRFERDHPSSIPTAGRRWRAFGRYHQALCEDDQWSQHMLASRFAKAYEEQVRLISTLHSVKG